MDYTDIACQKRLIKIFLNSVFVYDDKVILTFNYSDDGKILTLHEIDGGSGHSIRIPSGLVHHEKTRSCFRRSAFFYYDLCGNLPRVTMRKRAAAPKACHPERRAKPEVEGSSHQIPTEQTASAKILRLAPLAQDDNDCPPSFSLCFICQLKNPPIRADLFFTGCP